MGESVPASGGVAAAHYFFNCLGRDAERGVSVLQRRIDRDGCVRYAYDLIFRDEGAGGQLPVLGENYIHGISVDILYQYHTLCIAHTKKQPRVAGRNSGTADLPGRNDGGHGVPDWQGRAP